MHPPLPAGSKVSLSVEILGPDGDLLRMGTVHLDAEQAPYTFKATGIAAQRAIYNLLEVLWPEQDTRGLDKPSKKC